MSTYLFELPTTGAISFGDFCVDATASNAYASHIAEATQARANLRSVLKATKRTDTDDKDYLRLIKVRITVSNPRPAQYISPRFSMTTSHTCTGS
jgi:hypothetical protein